MTWPQWIETLKERYLAEQASVFVLHGAVRSGRWSYAGEAVDCPELLRRFLERSRDMVGLLDWETASVELRPRLRFPGIEDRGRFARHLGARMVLDGVSESLQPTTAEKALGLIWMALDTPGASQGWILTQSQRLAHARKRQSVQTGLNGPALETWATAPWLRESNNVVVLLVEDLAELSPDLVAQCSVIQVPESALAAPAPAVSEPTADDAMAEIEAALSAASHDSPDPFSLSRGSLEDPPEDGPIESLKNLDAKPTFVMEPESGGADPIDAESASEPAPTPAPMPAPSIESALRQAILRAPKGPWPHRLPGREALAQVLHRRAPEHFGSLSFEVVDDQVRCAGAGAENFETWYRGDIAVDAAVGMALGALEPPAAGFTEETLPVLASPAIRALTRRIDKYLDSL